MENRDKYLWRPNDNSSKTLIRYDLEGAHWIDSIKNSTSPTTSFGEFFGFFGLLLSFIINIIHFIVLILIELVKWIIKVWPKKKDKYDGVPTFANRKKLTGPEARAIIDKANESGVIEEIDFN